MSAFLGKAFMDWLVKAGVLTPEERTRRVILDIVYDRPVKVYIEDFADSSMLRFDPPDVSEAVIERAGGDDRGPFANCLLEQQRELTALAERVAQLEEVLRLVRLCRRQPASATPVPEYWTTEDVRNARPAGVE